jgi:hypothetical protein
MDVDVIRRTAFLPTADCRATPPERLMSYCRYPRSAKGRCVMHVTRISLQSDVVGCIARILANAKLAFGARAAA